MKIIITKYNAFLFTYYKYVILDENDKPILFSKRYYTLGTLEYDLDAIRDEIKETPIIYSNAAYKDSI